MTSNGFLFSWFLRSPLSEPKLLPTAVVQFWCGYGDRCEHSRLRIDQVSGSQFCSPMVDFTGACCCRIFDMQLILSIARGHAGLHVPSPVVVPRRNQQYAVDPGGLPERGGSPAVQTPCSDGASQHPVGGLMLWYSWSELEWFNTYADFWAVGTAFNGGGWTSWGTDTVTLSMSCACVLSTDLVNFHVTDTRNVITTQPSTCLFSSRCVLSRSPDGR